MPVFMYFLYFDLTVWVSYDTATVEEKEISDINLAVAGTKDAINMVEAGAKEVSEEEMLEIYRKHFAKKRGK